MVWEFVENRRIFEYRKEVLDGEAGLNNKG